MASRYDFFGDLRSADANRSLKRERRESADLLCLPPPPGFTVSSVRFHNQPTASGPAALPPYSARFSRNTPCAASQLAAGWRADMP